MKRNLLALGAVIVLLLALVATCSFAGDGVITPAPQPPTATTLAPTSNPPTTAPQLG